VLDLLANPNSQPNEVGIDFHKLRFVNMGIAGNAYCLVITSGGQPSSLLNLFPQWTRIIPGSDQLIDAYAYGVTQAQQVEYDPEDIIHFVHERDPQNPYYGRGPLKAVWNEHQLYIAANQKALTLYDNQARPDFVVNLEVPPNTDQLKQLEQSIWKKLQGVARAGNFLIMPSKGSITPLTFNPKDMGEEEMKKNLGTTIAAAFGVPESIIHLNDANLASATAGNITFARWAILPRLIRDAAMWTERLLPMFGMNPGDYWLCYDNPVVEDEAANAAVLVSMTGAGLMTINEARADQGLEPIEGGDVPRFQGKSLDAIDAPPVPLGDPFGGGKAPPDDAGGKPDAEPDKEDPKEKANGGRENHSGGVLPSRNSTFGEGALGTQQANAANRATPDAPKLPADNHAACSNDECDHKHSHSLRASQKALVEADAYEFLKQLPDIDPPGIQTEPPEFGWYRKLRLMFNVQRETIISNMEKSPSGLQYRGYSRKEEPAINRLLRLWGITAADLDKVAAPTAALTMHYVTDSVQGAAKEAMVQIGLDYPETYTTPTDDNFPDILLHSHAVSDAIRRRESAYLKGLGSASETTAAGLSETLAQGVEAGETILELQSRVQEYFDHLTPQDAPFSAVRAATIARTEMANGQIAGTVAGWKTTDVVERKKWLLRGGACPICEALARDFNDGIALDQPFAALGSTITGTDGSTFSVDYQDVFGPPAHPNCGCGLAPAIKGYSA